MSRTVAHRTPPSPPQPARRRRHPPVAFGPDEVTRQTCRYAAQSAARAVLQAQIWGATDARAELERLAALGDQARHLATQKSGGGAS